MEAARRSPATPASERTPETVPETQPWEALARGAEVRAEVLWAAGFALEHPGSVRERYVVERPLGRGAMGQVLAVRLLEDDGPAGGRSPSVIVEDSEMTRGGGEVYALKVVARPTDAHSPRAPTRSLAPRLTPPPPAPASSSAPVEREKPRALELVGDEALDVWDVDDSVPPPVAAAPSPPPETAVSSAISEAERRAVALSELLRREAARQDLARRHGVSVARLFALVRLADGSLGMRMELARGRSLEQWLRREGAQRDRSPDVAFCARVVRRLLSQLRRLHRLDDARHPGGFVHCDVKPGNVFVDDADAGDPHVTLLDFGVSTAGGMLVAGAALLGENAAQGAQRDAHGRAPGAAASERERGRVAFEQSLVLEQAGGTLGYAPPGHFSLPPTPVSDAHAALVLLYECITLELPWEAGETAWRPEHLAELEDAMRRGPRPVRAVRGSISAAAARVLDGFFVREFAALHKLCDAGLAARARGDVGRWQQAVFSLDLSGRCASRVEQLAAALERATRAAPGLTHFAAAGVSATSSSAPPSSAAVFAASATSSQVPSLRESAPPTMPEAAPEQPFFFGDDAPGAKPRARADAAAAHSMGDEPAPARAPSERPTVPSRAVVAAAPAPTEPANPPSTTKVPTPYSLPPPGVELARPRSVPPPGFASHPARRPLRVAVALAALGLSSFLLSVGSRERPVVRTRGLTAPAPALAAPQAASSPVTSPASSPASSPEGERALPAPTAGADEGASQPVEPSHQHHPLGCSSPLARTSIELRDLDGHLRDVLCVTDRAGARNAGGTMGVGNVWDPSRDDELTAAHREGRLRCAASEVPAGTLRASLGRLDDEGGPSGWVVRCRVRVSGESASVIPAEARVVAPERRAAPAAAVTFTPAPPSAEPPARPRAIESAHPRAEAAPVELAPAAESPREHAGAQVPTSATPPVETP